MDFGFSFPDHIDEKRGSATAKPIIAEMVIRKQFKDRKRIIDPGKPGNSCNKNKP